ncbi:MAG: putative flagellar hook-associated protein 3 FlgL-like [Burkholderia sp.]|jgi:flagellar hook-associated protein 3 FlgL|nr:putative flagellar hook-associated protein 3 FlgL-like [Burkholderia sp.]
MRISTNTIFELGSRGISDMQASLVKTQQQLSTQRRVLTPADDPVAAATALGITQSISVNEQYAANRQTARSSLSEEESVLQSVTTLLQDAKQLVVNAGNGAMEDSQRQFLAAELRGRFEELMGLANSRDGNGNYMFGGFQTATQPFSKTLAGAAYAGDQGQRMLQVGASRQIPLNDTGYSVFENNKTGNGVFVTAARTLPANTGSGIVSSGAVFDSSKLTGQKYSIDFTVVASGSPGVPDTTTFVVRNDTVIPTLYMDPATGLVNLPAPPVIASTFVEGESIKFAGMEFNIKGKPADGDGFTIDPSRDQSVFKTMTDLLSTLGQSGMGANGQANLTNGLNTANNNIDHALDNVLNVRAAVGTRLKELDVLDSGGSDLNIQYIETLHKLQDIDLAETISAFTQQNMVLEAAQKSFMKVSGMSLFNFI